MSDEAVQTAYRAQLGLAQLLERPDVDAEDIRWAMLGMVSTLDGLFRAMPTPTLEKLTRMIWNTSAVLRNISAMLEED